MDLYSSLLILFCLNSSSQMETASFLDPLFPAYHAATLKVNLSISAFGSLGSIITPLPFLTLVSLLNFSHNGFIIFRYFSL